MKVIDLLNKWANGEDVNAIDEKGYFGGSRKLLDNLNSEIELEDTPKEDKKIAKIGKLNQVSDNKQHLNNYILRNKLNEIIDRLNGEDNE